MDISGCDRMADKSRFYRWVEVKDFLEDPERKLFRSSAPGYSGDHDTVQELDKSDITWLEEIANSITRILSLNECLYSADARGKLAEARIDYEHRPVTDYTPPTLDDVHFAVNMRKEAPPGNMLVHCGYGFGRTGTLITAMQLQATNGSLSLGSLQKTLEDLMKNNHVERDEQRNFLKEYQRQLIHHGEL